MGQGHNDAAKCQDSMSHFPVSLADSGQIHILDKAAMLLSSFNPTASLSC